MGRLDETEEQGDRKEDPKAIQPVPGIWLYPHSKAKQVLPWPHLFVVSSDRSCFPKSYTGRGVAGAAFPCPRPLAADFSEIEVRASGRKVLEIRRDNTCSFKVVTYEQGDWQRELRDWPDPVPFD
jgi:hypothetical protein